MGKATAIPHAVDAADAEILKTVMPFSVAGPWRLLAVIDAARHVVRHGIEGAFVECGVLRGGATMAAALAFLDEGTTDRDIHLFDTFEGMPAPTDADFKRRTGISAKEILEGRRRVGVHGSDWAMAPESEVRGNLARVPYPPDRIHFTKGLVEETIPEAAPDRIAVLRLDTDFYESTRHELQELVHRVSPHGVVLIDDYGSWDGARRAVDEFLAGSDRPFFLQRTDADGRAFVVP